MARWLVDLKGKRVTQLGTVNAITERGEEASRRFSIEPVGQLFRVVVTKISENDKA